MMGDTRDIESTMDLQLKRWVIVFAAWSLTLLISPLHAAEATEPLLGEMRARLAGDGYRFGGAVESIVTSRQFLNQRGEGPKIP